MCGWTDVSLNAAVYSWERRQRGETLPDSGPSSDYTTGTATGIVDLVRICICRIAWSITFKHTITICKYFVWFVLTVFSWKLIWLHIPMVETGCRVKKQYFQLVQGQIKIKRCNFHHAGFFVGISEVESEDCSTAVFISPVIRESSATCRLQLRYFLWDSGKGHFFGFSAF